MSKKAVERAETPVNQARSLSARVLDFAEKAAPSSTHRVRIVALGPDILRALADGWSMRMIWKTLHTEGTLTCGYDTFRAHVKKLRQAPVGTRSALSPKSGGPPAAPSAPSSGFTFNPIPNLEELI